MPPPNNTGKNPQIKSPFKPKEQGEETRLPPNKTKVFFIKKLFMFKRKFPQNTWGPSKLRQNPQTP